MQISAPRSCLLTADCGWATKKESAGGNFKRSHGNQTVYFTQYAFDKDGNLWILRCPSGICLASRANATRNNVIDWKNSITSRLDQPSQLSTLVPSTAFEDSEGNVWIGTAIGVERFRNNVLLPAPPRLDVGYYGMFRDGANMIWIMEWRSEKVMRFDIGKQKLEVLSDFQGALSQAADGAIVSSGKSDIRILRSGQETHVPYPTAVVAGHDEAVIGRAFDDGERIWLLGGDIDYVREGNSWYSATARGYPSTSHYRWVGDRGHFWVGMDDGGLMLFEHGKASRTYSQDDVGNIGTIMDFSWSPELVVTGETGIAVMSRGRFRRITVDVDAHLHQITGFYVAADGTRWLNGKAGLLRVQPDDWRAAVERGVRLRYHLFDALDGYPGIARSFPRDDSLLMVDGKLWIIGSGGIAQIDPRRQERNPVAPEPEILSVMGDGVAYPISGIPVIRPGTTRLRFDFTAPSLRKPERVMFSYRLDGVDSEWQTSSERSATYTELAPGDYRFRVRAMNEDGVRSRAERTLALHVQPTLTQTWWFKAACVMALFLLLWLAHLARLRMATRVLTERLQAQTQERERIARDLHDTVLQTFQSVVLKVKAASLGAGTDSDTRSALENSMRAANEAIEEGRDKVHSLRAAGLGGASLAEYLRALGEREAGGRHFVLRCVGQARPLRPGVEDELGAIGREALCNAFRHAQASEHEVVIAFGRREMSLTVRDNGRGISADDLGKDGHWGLRGIEERALSIHADATLATSPASGTTWEIRLGAALAYSSQRSTVRWLFLRGLST
jgi:signal transduction histidine kinase